MTTENALGNAGYAIFGSGGGGAGGNYVFASLEELDSIKTDWIALRDDIISDGTKLLIARDALYAPADDIMSGGQYSATRDSINSAIEHNKAMSAYAESYINKLASAIKQYAVDDEINAARARSIQDDQ